ncbi:hypothetical protein ACIQK9_19555 [Streptomyces hydrogenans]|uniref:hypothetical protein n=1 Tax=Streptomyces hydrogenans TaxID=1873719 RepID=UPI00380C258B
MGPWRPVLGLLEEPRTTTGPPCVRFELAGALVLAASATTAAVLLRGLPGTLPIDRTAGDTARPEDGWQPFVPGRRYVLGVPDAHTEDGPVSPGRRALFATSAGGTRVEAERKRRREAVAHQNPVRARPACDDTVHTP